MHTIYCNIHHRVAYIFNELVWFCLPPASSVHSVWLNVPLNKSSLHPFRFNTVNLGFISGVWQSTIERWLFSEDRADRTDSLVGRGAHSQSKTHRILSTLYHTVSRVASSIDTQPTANISEDMMYLNSFVDVQRYSYACSFCTYWFVEEIWDFYGLFFFLMFCIVVRSMSIWWSYQMPSLDLDLCVHAHSEEVVKWTTKTKLTFKSRIGWDERGSDDD